MLPDRADVATGLEVGAGASTDRPWWRDAVIYEIYPRSFCDASGDGEGDLLGIRRRLPYLADLGVDAIWVAPWFPSPLADGGYDVTDYCDVDPMYGTLGDADRLVEEAHRHAIKVIIDMVANHTSDSHPWFQAAARAAPGSPDRDWYHFRDGRGDAGSLPPNNWISAFGGPAWTRLPDADGAPGQWYLHTFAPEQPDLNWGNERVRTAFDEVLRFWFDRGVDGVRVDAAPGFAKQDGLPDADYGEDVRFVAARWVDNPHWDVDGVHDILRRWRAVGDRYDPERVFVAEAVVNGAQRLSRYVRPDEMHSAFNFPFLMAPWGPGLRQVVDETLAVFQPIGAAPTWVLASHDETRLVTRYGRRQSGSSHLADPRPEAPDLSLGWRRGRAATLLMLALPGSAYVYQGEELGLPEVEDLPDDVLQDPVWLRSGRTVRGRDGCRVPMPWSGDKPPYGFSDRATTTWLPQPRDWGRLTVEAQRADPDSMLSLYRAALRLRREQPGFHTDDFAWSPGTTHGVLDFERAGGLRCVVNLGDVPVAVGAGWDVLLTSVPLEGGTLPRDAAAWLRRS